MKQNITKRRGEDNCYANVTVKPPPGKGQGRWTQTARKFPRRQSADEPGE